MFLLLLNLFIPSGKVPTFLKLSSAHAHIMGMSMKRRDQNPKSQKHQHTWCKMWELLNSVHEPGVVLELKTGNYCACFNLKSNMCMTFAFPTNLSLSQPMSFLAFPLPVFSPILLLGEWASGCVGFGCCLGLNHNTNLLFSPLCLLPYTLAPVPCFSFYLQTPAVQK